MLSNFVEFKNIEIADPGFLNIYFHISFWKEYLSKVIKLNAKKFNIDILAGGGDTVLAINKANAEEGFNYISNAGGAFLEWLEGNESPGVNALRNNDIS